LKNTGKAPLGVDVKLALIYFQLGKYAEAVKILEPLHERHPDQERITFYLASSLEAQGNLSQALELFSLIKPQSDFYYDARIHAAYLLEKQGLYRRGIDIVESLIREYPDKTSLYRMLSSLYEKSGDGAKSIAVLKDALAKFPGNYKLTFALGALYHTLGDEQQSISTMQMLLKENPDDATVLNFIGYTYVELGVQLDDAEKLIRKALSLKPDSGFILDSMGWLFYARGDYEQALTYLLRAAKQISDDPVILEHLGDVYQKLGKKERAREVYQRSLKLKNEERVAAKLKVLEKPR
jgi:tetratricopeptide (TPR) repeat protein